MEVSNAFVVFMGMGITFIGLTCIIFLTMLMGKIMRRFEKPAPPQQAASAPTSAAPAVPADGVTEEVKVAILMALMQQPGFRMEDVRSIDIRRV